MNDAASGEVKRLGFWACWALAVGTMIGSGVFLLPAVLAPYGLLSFGGWIIAGLGSIALALCFARLASRTTRSGGPYVYVQDVFGDLAGFLMAWSYWISYWTAIPAIAIAFVGYLEIFAPTLSGRPLWQAGAGLALIWLLTLVSIRGLREASLVQITMTVLKIIPLLLVIGLGAVAGESANLPSLNPSGSAPLAALAAVALLTLWPFTGFEAGALPAGDCKDPQRTIPRAIIAAILTVTAIYLGATTAVMLLVPPEQLAVSTAPFAEAARGLGAFGPQLVAAGALIATAGTLNGVIFVAGQMPMAVALDQLAPRALARVNSGGAPYFSLLLSSTLGSILLLLNYSRGLIGAFTFIVMMSTVTILLPYFLSALAELRQSWRNAKAWSGVALIGALYAAFAIFGSGLEVLAWGLALTLLGLPLYWAGQRRRAAQALEVSPS